MSAVILCAFPSGNSRARSWILGRVASLAVGGEAELKFVATEPATPDRVAIETIAIGIVGIERGHALVSAWRGDALFPASIEIRLLQTEAVSLNIPMLFP